MNSPKNTLNYRYRDLRRADFTNWDLSFANFTHAIMTDACMVCVDLICANLTGADLTNVNLTGARLIDSILIGANFTRVNLTQTVLVNVVLNNDSSGPHRSLLYGGMRKDGCQFYLQRFDVNDYRVKANCLYFTVAEAYQYWNNPAQSLGVESLSFVDTMLEEAARRNWN